MSTDFQPAPHGPTPLSPDEIAVAITEEAKIIRSLLEEIQLIAEKSAHTETDYKVRFAKARLRAWADAEESGKKINVDRAEDIATVATEDERLQFLINMQLLSSSKEALKARIARMNSLQTLAGMAQKAAG